MIRYISQAMIEDEVPYSYVQSDRVTIATYEPDPAPQRTGLVDVRGNPIMRVNEVGPVGFKL